MIAYLREKGLYYRMWRLNSTISGKLPSGGPDSSRRLFAFPPTICWVPAGGLLLFSPSRTRLITRHYYYHYWVKAISYLILRARHEEGRVLKAQGRAVAPAFA